MAAALSSLSEQKKGFELVSNVLEKTNRVEPFGPNPLPEWFDKHQGQIIHKWTHYFDIYHKHFASLRAAATAEKKLIMWEIGVSHGGSIEMWRDYFGHDKCEIYGIDIDSKCEKLSYPNVKIIIGDQGNADFLNHLCQTLPRPDIILDDGGHLMHQQILTMEILFPHLKPNGVFMCEDTHTSFWPDWGSPSNIFGNATDPHWDHKTSYIERVKRLIDSLHASYYKHLDNAFATYFHTWGDSVTVYDSVVVLEKKSEPKPQLASVYRGLHPL